MYFVSQASKASDFDVSPKVSFETETFWKICDCPFCLLVEVVIALKSLIIHLLRPSLAQLEASGGGDEERGNTVKGAARRRAIKKIALPAACAWTGEATLCSGRVHEFAMIRHQRHRRDKRSPLVVLASFVLGLGF
uniref:Uncharacterized protein n=1 Tax=Steinernema glaseri TaxID=37863 RepID=A0A1I7ZE39_9BILA